MSDAKEKNDKRPDKNKSIPTASFTDGAGMTAQAGTSPSVSAISQEDQLERKKRIEANQQIQRLARLL